MPASRTTTVVARIRRLPEHLANKIAAGEVVERPASVVKELVENSLDAGAHRIDVTIEEGGRDGIEVRDDGAGMGRDDARACLERHATSKLREDSDLFAITTLGFRGEALPSIASVSRLTILTRLHDDIEGTRVIVDGGQVREVASIGAPPGTTARVTDLFYNVPARRKFLRRPSTEAGHVSETMVRLALAHPEVSFSLTHQGRTLLSLPAGEGLEARVVAALGREIHGSLHPLEQDLGDIRLEGFFASPQITRASSKGIYTFVNRRFVRDRQITHAIKRAYATLVDRARSPVVVLFIEVPIAGLDVNVHPQKIEVRFSDARGVYNAVHGTLSRHLALSPWVGEARSPVRVQPPDVYAGHKQRVLDALQRFEQAPRPESLAGRALLRDQPAQQGALVRESAGYFGALRVVGQLRASYILCDGPDGLVVIDQHAAHERMEFERLRASWAQGPLAGQRLLVPRTLEVGVAQAERLEGAADRLRPLGFDLNHLGSGTIAVREVPAGLRESELDGVIRDLLDDLGDVEPGAAVDEAVRRLLATVACHTVVRAGEVLSLQACEALVRRMDAIPFKSNCPHGRPVAFELDLSEIERRFGRR